MNWPVTIDNSKYKLRSPVRLARAEKNTGRPGQSERKKTSVGKLAGGSFVSNFPGEVRGHIRAMAQAGAKIPWHLADQAAVSAPGAILTRIAHSRAYPPCSYRARGGDVNFPKRALSRTRIL